MEFRPQKGYQENVLSTPADICISGASAGVGKTFALLLEFTRHIHNKNWGGVIFRRTTPQIRNEGGLWDASTGIYSYLGAKPKESVLEWHFKSGAKLKFSHLEHEKDKISWQGAEIPFIGFDELTHFTESQFFYLLSRNRSTTGITPYVRATCNPDPDSWVASLISWWINQETGYPIEDRDGRVRYFMRHDGNYIWGDTKQEVIEKGAFVINDQVEKSGGLIKAEDFVKSLTFISGSIYDNIELLKQNPEYLANLNAQDEETKKQLLDGNWKISISGKDIYDYYAFQDIFTNSFVLDERNNNRYITADIALDGSDKFVVLVWKGFAVVDILVMDKSNGREIIDAIRKLSIIWRVPERNVVYDNDGVGGFIGGFMSGAQSFRNGSRPLLDQDYKNLKTQCYYKSGARVKENQIYIMPEVAEKTFADNLTVKAQFIKERKAIKKDKLDNDGKNQIIDKSEMKTHLDGKSPDLMDAFMMREYFELAPKKKYIRKIN